MKRLALLALLCAACDPDAGPPPDEGGDLSPQEAPLPSSGKADESWWCPGINASIVPNPVPERLCLPPQPGAAAIMDDVNAFWASDVQLCTCGPDSAGDCELNAFSLFDTGYVYYDPAILELVTDEGSLLPAVWLLGHEFGHEIQGHYTGRPQLLLHQELAADCFAGYVLGSLVCQGRANLEDLRQVVVTVCELATTGSDVPWLNVHTHGRCQDRVDAVIRGADGYLAGADAVLTCTYGP